MNCRAAPPGSLVMLWILVYLVGLIPAIVILNWAGLTFDWSLLAWFFGAGVISLTLMLMILRRRWRCLKESLSG